MERKGFLGGGRRVVTRPRRQSVDADRHAARAKLAGRYRQIADAMGDDPFAVGTAMSIADCYLFVTLMWARQAEVPISQTLSRYYDRISKRPAVERALAQEGLA